MFKVLLAIITVLSLFYFTSASYGYCPQLTNNENVYGGYFDKWTLPEDEDKNFKHIRAGTKLESGRVVQDRVDAITNQYKDRICITGTQYVLYTLYALRNHNQDTQNAPIAVQKREESGGESEDVDHKVMTEVVRTSFWTTSQSVRNQLMPNIDEVVAASANTLIVAYSMMAPLIVMTIVFLVAS